MVLVQPLRHVRRLYSVNKSPTQAVSGADVDLKDGHAAPSAPSRFPFDDDLINETSSVTPSEDT